MVVENGSCVCVCVCVFLFVVTWENEKKKKVRTFFSPSPDIFRVDLTHEDSNSDYVMDHHQEVNDVEVFDE